MNGGAWTEVCVGLWLPAAVNAPYWSMQALHRVLTVRLSNQKAGKNDDIYRVACIAWEGRFIVYAPLVGLLSGLLGTLVSRPSYSVSIAGKAGIGVAMAVTSGIVGFVVARKYKFSEHVSEHPMRGLQVMFTGITLWMAGSCVGSSLVLPSFLAGFDGLDKALAIVVPIGAVVMSLGRRLWSPRSGGPSS